MVPPANEATMNPTRQGPNTTNDPVAVRTSSVPSTVTAFMESGFIGSTVCLGVTVPVTFSP